MRRSAARVLGPKLGWSEPIRTYRIIPYDLTRSNVVPSKKPSAGDVGPLDRYFGVLVAFWREFARVASTRLICSGPTIAHWTHHNILEWDKN